MSDREKMEELDTQMSMSGNIEMINADLKCEVIWNRTESEQLCRTEDGKYLMGNMSYYYTSNEEAAYWLLKSTYPLPNELLEHKDAGEKRIEKSRSYNRLAVWAIGEEGQVTRTEVSDES